MNRSSIEGLRLNVKKVAVSVLAAALFAGAVFGQGKSGDAPDLGDCDHLQVAAGNKLFFRVYAEGVQIYRWSGTSWVFVAPEAVLSANPGGTGVVGLHYAGPTWESITGGKVVATRLDGCSPDATAIPWLLLQTVSADGIFSPVTFIQRVNTKGGLMPTAPGISVGAVAEVPYSTEYYFYRAKN